MHPVLRLTRPATGGGPSGLLQPLAVGGAALAGAGYVAAVDPNSAGHYPTCPFLAVTGWYCPGCGALRAVHALGHGDLMTALARNPLAVVAIGCLVVAWVVWLTRAAAGRPLRWMVPQRGARTLSLTLYGALGVILVFWVLRNLPGWAWLSPA